MNLEVLKLYWISYSHDCTNMWMIFANPTKNSILIAKLFSLISFWYPSCSSFCRPVRIQADIQLLNIYFEGQPMASQDPVRYSAPEYLFCNYFVGQFMAKSGRDGSCTLDNSWCINVVLDFIELWLHKHVNDFCISNIIQPTIAFW